MDVLIKWASRSRPHIFRKVLPLWQADETARFLVTIDADDSSMNNAEMLAFLDVQPRLKYRVGDSNGKIEAMNDGLDEETWNGLLIMAQDDVLPTRSDYAQHIAKLFQQHFPDGDGVLHLFDGYRSDLNTSVCCDRKYFDRFGYIYHKDYRSDFADNEWDEVARSLNRSVYVPECVLKHEWIRLTGEDALNRYNESFFPRDKVVFEARKSAGFPNERIEI